MKRIIQSSLLALICLTLRAAAESPPAATTRPADPAPDAAVLEKQFAALHPARQWSASTRWKGAMRRACADRYRILKAVKADGDNWTITSNIEYKGFGIPVEMAIPVKWAGDTPVIEVTDMKVPGIGTFTARVLFSGGRYVGTWSGGPGHAGTMWGRIEHEEKTGAATTKPHE